MGGARERCAQLEAELRDYKEIAEQTCNVSHLYSSCDDVLTGNGMSQDSVSGRVS